jgi:hypothetical protein
LAEGQPVLDIYEEMNRDIKSRFAWPNAAATSNVSALN